MSFTDTLSLDNAAGAEATFVLLSRDATGTRRLDNSSTPAEPRACVIKHTTSGVGQAAVDRHLVQFSITKLDAETIPRTGIVNLTLTVPRATVITSAMIYDLVSNVVDLISDGGFTESGLAGTVALAQLVRGEA